MSSQTCFYKWRKNIKNIDVSQRYKTIYTESILELVKKKKKECCPPSVRIKSLVTAVTNLQ